MQWEYLGFADSTVPWSLFHGVTTVYVDEVSGVILVGLATPPTTGIGLFRSEDNGDTWTPSDSGIRTEEHPWSSQVQYVIGSSSLEHFLLLGTFSAIYRSEDGGISWTVVYGDPEAGAPRVNVITFNSSYLNKVWGGGGTGRGLPYAVRSSDNGETWDLLYPLPPLGPYGKDNEVHSIVVDPVNSGIIYLGMIGLVMKTTDNGDTWQKVLGWEDGIHSILGLVINPYDVDELFATGLRLYRTDNGGKTWQKKMSPDGRIGLYALIVDWSKRILYVSASSPGNGIYKLKF